MLQTRLQLLHTWTTRLQHLVPDVHVTIVRVVALLSLALSSTTSTTVIRVAAGLPAPDADLSTERRLRRWLANPAVDVQALWTPLLRAFLARCQGQELTLVFSIPRSRLIGPSSRCSGSSSTAAPCR